jgi:long-chain acyl-CoA synthetase
LPADTVVARLFEQAAQRPQAPAHVIKRGGRWQEISWRSYADDVRRVGKALLALGVEPGGTTAILGFNRPEWVVFNVSTMAVGGAPAGIYTTCSSEEIAYIVGHAESRIVLVETEEQWQRVAAVRDRLPALRHVVTMRDAPAIDDELVMSWDELLARGEDVGDDAFDARVAGLEMEGLATLIYTSGTTGPPKGVMLSHRNLAWTSQRVAELVGARPDDWGLSYLPLSHIAEQLLTVHAPPTTGAAVYFAESIDKVPENLKEIQPTVIFGVPRIWEKFHAAVSAKLAEAPAHRRALLDWVRRVCTRVNDAKNRGESPDLATRLQYEVAHRLVLSKLKPLLGLGNARAYVSGAAPINKEILEFFSSLDIVIREVYGQSEDTGPTSLNLPGRTKLGSVGPPLPGVNVRLADDGEILVKGPNVFLGYYKDEAATREALADGWLHSGDLGRIDNEGYLHITGRKKEIIITAGGKNITPVNIEAGLKNSELVAEAVVIGDRRKYLTALLTLDEEAARKYAEDGIAPHESEWIRRRLQSVVDEVNRDLARVEQIKRFTVLPRPFSIEDGELTPTLKIKRNVVAKNFAREIDKMYEGGEATRSAG